MNLIAALLALGMTGGEDRELPRDLWTEVAPLTEPRADSGLTWTIGPRLGYEDSSDADRGTWTAGAQARLHIFPWLAAEASIEFHQNRYQDGDEIVTTFPIQFSGLVYLPVNWPLRPYALAGIGFYHTVVNFRGSLSSVDDEHDFTVGFHAGIGLEWQLTPTISINGDVRFIFMDEPAHVTDNFDFWQFTVGVNFKIG